jgi:hypothetical protein
MSRHAHIKLGDTCEIVEIHPQNAFYEKKERFLGKRVIVVKIYNERTAELWLDVDAVLLEEAYPYKKGREVPLYKVRLKKHIIN